MFKWAASEELVAPSVYHGLQAVAGLRRGRSAARETGPVLPVEVDLVEKTLPHLPPHVAGILELMLHTGMRPGEACRIRLAEIDRSAEVWLYRPSRHKTAHHGHARVIAIGPKAQAVLRRFIRVRCPQCGPVGRQEVLGVVEGGCPGCGGGGGVGIVEAHPPSEPLFSPWWQREERYLEMRRARKTKVQPSQENRRKEEAQRVPGTTFLPTTIAHAVNQACKRHQLPHWHPNQLRHTHATMVRRAFGLEAAQVVLGHSKADITQVYAERDEALAASVALKMG
jgi:integrase